MALIPIKPKCTDVIIDAQAQLAKEDPLDKISQELEDRGFGGQLWTERKRSKINGKPSRVQFSERCKRLYLRTLATTGRPAYAAAACNISLSSVKNATNNDPIFSMAVEEANEYFRDLIQGELIRRGIEGYHEEVLGGRNRDQIFKLKRYSDKAIDLLARIHIAQLNKEGRTTTVDNSQNLTVNNNSTFEIEKMDGEELAMFKSLVESQAKRDAEVLLAKEEKVINDRTIQHE